MRTTIWFDDNIYVKGKTIPFWDFTVIEEAIEDSELRWFHEGYGCMQLYRLWKVDDGNFIAEKMRGCMVFKGSKNFKEWMSNPELAIKDL